MYHSTVIQTKKHVIVLSTPAVPVRSGCTSSPPSLCRPWASTTPKRDSCPLLLIPTGPGPRTTLVIR